METIYTFSSFKKELNRILLGQPTKLPYDFLQVQKIRRGLLPKYNGLNVGNGDHIAIHYAKILNEYHEGLAKNEGSDVGITTPLQSVIPILIHEVIHSYLKNDHQHNERYSTEGLMGLSLDEALENPESYIRIIFGDPAEMKVQANR